jgi:hypothetical protein
MSGYSVVFLDKTTLAKPLNVPASLSFVVERYRKRDLFGCASAEISVRGDLRLLLGLSQYLRCGVEIISDENGECVWWGYLNEIATRVGKINLHTTLDEMANTVAVAYILNTQDQSTRETTSWRIAPLSVNEYGTKELLHSAGDSTKTQADALAIRILTEQSQPITRTSIADGEQGVATLTCLGWGETLSWRYYKNVLSALGNYANVPQQTQSANLAYLPEPEDSTVNVGDVAASTMCAMQVLVPGTQASILRKIQVKCVKIGSPTDDLICDVYSETGANAPAVLLTSSRVPSSSVSTSHAIEDFTPETEVALAANSKIWLVLRRAGTNNSANYYRWTGKLGLTYADGVAKRFDGTAWQTLPPTFADQDLFFSIELSDTPNVDIGAVDQRRYVEWFFYYTYSTSYVINEIGIWLARQGNPVDSVQVEAWLVDGSGNILSFLGLGSVVASSVPTTFGRVSVSIATTTLVASGSRIKIRVSRTGAVDAFNFVRMQIDPSRSDYAVDVYDSSNVKTDYTSSAVFDATPSGESAAQIKQIVTSVGQFITGVDTLETTGVYSPVNRDGDNTAYDIIAAICEAGCDDGRRVSVEISRDRRLRIRREQNKNQQTYLINRDGELIYGVTRAIRKNQAVVGVWAKFQDAIYTAKLNDAVFVTENEFSVASGTSDLVLRNSISDFAIPSVRQG